jgi:RNA-directed DNA polymerase
MQELNDLIDSGQPYTPTKEKKFKSDGSIRPVYNPHPKIRFIQKKINNTFFNPKNFSNEALKKDTSSKSPNAESKKTKDLLIWPDYLFGSVPMSELSIDSNGDPLRRDYIACAEKHCGRESILKIDISDFYENIHISDVEEIFSNILLCDENVSSMLAKFCCFKDTVPQGGLTSSFIAMLVLYDIEPQLVQRLDKKKLRYTRLIDDITVSSFQRNYDFSLTISLIKDVLNKKDLPFNEKKLSISSHSSSTTLVHGLRVNYGYPRLPQGEVSKIRATVRKLEKLSMDNLYRVTRDYRKDFNHCLGRVNRMKAIGHKQANGLILRLNRIKPKTSYKDIAHCLEVIEELEDWHFNGKSRSYWFIKRCHYLDNELNILKRTFDVSAKMIRERLRYVEKP